MPKKLHSDELAARISEARDLKNMPAMGVVVGGGASAYGISPQFDHVLVQQPRHGVTERNGLFIPEVGRSQNTATVLAVGPGRYHDGVFAPCCVKLGDKVILAQAAYHPIAIDVRDQATGESEVINLLIVKEGLIIATMDSEAVTLLNAAPKKMYGYGHEGFDDGP